MENKDYNILYQVGDKVLVEWKREECSFYPKGVEYSVHTQIEDALHWGHYYKDYQDATNCFIKKAKVDKIIDTIIANYDEFEGYIEINENLEYIALENSVDDYFFDFESYRIFMEEYENLGIIKEYVSFKQYIVHSSLDW